MGKSRVILLVFSLIGLYYFFSPRRSGAELILSPLMISNLHLTKNTATEERIPLLANGNLAGFLDKNYQPLFFVSSEHNALTDNWLAYTENAGLRIINPKGKLLFSTEGQAHPIERDKRLFHYNDLSGELSERNPSSGQILWKRDYLSPITVLDAAQGRTLVGLLDGRIFVLDSKGDVLFQYRPGGSRLEAIYGATFSSQGERIALISGLDPQRFILLEERKNELRPVVHYPTGINLRRPLAIGFSRNERGIFYEDDERICLFKLADSPQVCFNFKGYLVDWIDTLLPSTLLLLSQDLEEASLQFFSLEAQTIFETTFPAKEVGLQVDGNHILLTLDNQLLVFKVDFL